MSNSIINKILKENIITGVFDREDFYYGLIEYGFSKEESSKIISVVSNAGAGNIEDNFGKLYEVLKTLFQ